MDSAVARAAQQEIARRQSLVADAEAILREGDLFYSKGLLRNAVHQYRNALLSLKPAPMVNPIRGVALSKYERAATEYSEKLIKEGRFDRAEEVINELLAPDVGSTHAPAIRLQKQLQEEDYFNKALSPEHAAGVGKVEQLMNEGNGLIALGDFDGASIRFAQVLAYDPYNTGARRALEKIDRLVVQYGEAAYDQSRSKMLGEVTEAWESKVPFAAYEAAGDFAATAAGNAGDPASTLRSKLNTIVFPNVSFNGAPIEEVLEYLTTRSGELDTLEQDSSRKGVNIILNLAEGVDTSQMRISLQLRSTPLGEILRYVTQQAGVKYQVDSYVVKVVPLSAASAGLVTRRFQVPPNFLSGAAMGGKAAAAADPFDTAPEGGGSELGPKLTALEFLKQNGVDFPPGSLAQFLPATSTLVVRNTQSNVDFIEALVAGGRSDVPRQILVKVRVVDVSELRLKELGFDWLLGPFNIGSDNIFGAGGTQGSTRVGATPTGGAAGDFPVVGANGLPVGQFPVTSPNRTGDYALTSDSIADVIANSVSGQAVGNVGRPNLAPGVFALTGVLTDPQFQVVVRAISQNTGADVLTVPSTVVRSGERAQIKSVREFIYPTEYDPPELPNVVAGGAFPVTPANPTAFETRELGSLLEVEPIIGPDDVTVDLNLVPEISEFLGFVNYGSPITAGASTTPITANRIVMPVFKTLKETTSVQVYDGQTVVMGGLIESTVEDVEDGLPVLGSVPVVGRLFRSSVDRRMTRAIVLFVSVRILDPAGQPVNEI